MANRTLVSCPICGQPLRARIMLFDLPASKIWYDSPGSWGFDDKTDAKSRHRQGSYDTSEYELYCTPRMHTTVHWEEHWAAERARAERVQNAAAASEDLYHQLQQFLDSESVLLNDNADELLMRFTNAVYDPDNKD